MAQKKLVEAIKAKEEGDAAVVVTHLVHAWQIKPATRIQVLAECVEVPLGEVVGDGKTKSHDLEWIERARHKQPADLGMLMQTLRSGTATRSSERMAALSDWNDPRLPSFLLDLFDHPPWGSKLAVPAWEQALAIIVRIGHPRLAIRLQQASEQFMTVVTSRVGLDVSNKLRKAMANLPEPEAPELSADEAALCGTLEAAFGGTFEAHVRNQKGFDSDTKQEARLLDAIFCDPQDDGPRAVYADWLTERDDPRGEFITMQLARANDWAADTWKHEKTLLTEHGRKWIGPLRIVMTNPVFDRGFPCRATRWSNKSGFSKLKSHPAWSTIETLCYPWDDLGKDAARIITNPNLRSLTGLGNADDELLVQLAKRDGLRRLQRLGLLYPANHGNTLSTWLDEAPVQQNLFLYHYGNEPTLPDRVEAVVDAQSSLRQLTLRMPGGDLYLKEYVAMFNETSLELLSIINRVDLRTTENPQLHISRGPSGDLDVFTFVVSRPMEEANDRDAELLIDWLVRTVGTVKMSSLRFSIEVPIRAQISGSTSVRTPPHPLLLQRVEDGLGMKPVLVTGFVNLAHSL